MRQLAVVLALTALALQGCADNVGDVDRTQPNKVKKADLKGAWYYRATIIDVPPTAGFTFVGEQSETEKIVWEIQESYLLAYRSYEHIEGQEQYAQRPGVPWTGAPIAAYAISSHFDIQREYNPATGEQSNVISENTTDRPWSQREYMRVDWSKNLIADFNFVTSNVKQNPVGYYVDETAEPNNPDRPQVSDKYIDVVNKIFAEPETDEFLSWWYGMPIPACYLYEAIDKDCSGQAVKVRHSFMKVEDHTLQYEARQYDDKDFARFGYFRNDRYVYDRERDLLEGKTRHLINRFNIWAQSRQCVDKSGAPIDPAGCGIQPTASPVPFQGAAPGRVDGAAFKVLPIKDRKVRPIVYWLNDQYPQELVPAARRVADEWDDVFRDTVANAWTLDGKPTAKADVPRMFILCEQNPTVDGKSARGLDVAKYDPSVVPHPQFNDDRAFCGDAGFSPKIGDLRYSMIYWVPAATEAGLLGYGPLASDPETGETLQGNAFVYGAAHETYSTWGADIVSLVNGQQKLDDFADGKYLLDYLHRNPSSPGVYKSGLHDKAEAARLRDRVERVRTLAKKGALKPDYVSANRERLKNSRLSSLLLTDEVATAMTGGRITKASQLPALDKTRFASLSDWRERGFSGRYKQRMKRLLQHNITGADFADESVLARALAYKQAGTAFEDIRKDFLAEIFVATTLHEVGHTLGLRHNFAASSDALNYFTSESNPDRDYWQLRKKEAGVAEPDGNLANNPTKRLSIVPRYWEFDETAKGALGQQHKDENALLRQVRKENAEKGIMELQYSSIMDYGMKMNSDWNGLGKYDRAAIRYGYADLLEVWGFDPKSNPNVPADDKKWGLADQLYPGEQHYSMYPELLAPNAASLDEQVKAITNRKVVRRGDLANRHLEVPYRFCSDEYEGGQSTCHVFDTGGDMWETVDAKIKEYENYYWFFNFKRGRVMFGLDLGGYLGRVYNRYFMFLSTQFKHMTNDEFFTRWDESCGVGRFEPEYGHYAGTDCGADQYLSSLDSLSFFSKVLSRPDVGTYGYNTKTAAYELDYDSTQNGGTKDELALTPGDARYADTRFNWERYGYDFYYKPVIIGSWWDKWLAVDALGDPETYFVQNKSTDDLKYVFNYRVIFPNFTNNLVGSFITEAFPYYAPYKTTDGKVVSQQVEYWTEKPRSVPTGSKFINPQEQYTARLAGAFDALMYFTDNYDQDFTWSLKMSLKGMGESETGPAADTVEVLDPITNRTYQAVKYTPMQVAYDKNGDPVKDANGNYVYEKVPGYLPIGYEFLGRVKAKYAATNNPDDLHYDLSFADIIRDAVHYYEYRE